tara:strand:+ start:15213 stop:16580 length:1368 start_codon:yes stop_codon:yes gene_type:complete
MFGLSKQEKQLKLQSSYQSELKDLLIQINSNTERTGFLAKFQGGGYDHADTLHNIFEDFGYPSQLNFFNFWNMYRRFSVASAIVEMPVDICWLSSPEINGSELFNKEFLTLSKNTKLWNRLKGLDKRQRIGRYAGLLIEVRDGKKLSEPVDALNGVGSISNLKPIYEGQLEVVTTNKDQTSDDFDKPTMYSYNSSATGDRSDESTFSGQVHPSRLIIAAEGADDGSIYGISALENIYNDLMDLRKISGSGGEGFYQNTRSAPVITTKDGFKAPSDKEGKAALEKEIDDFLGKWQKKFVSQGLEFNYPNIKLDNPKEFADIAWSNISAGSKLPSDEIRGTQTGVLAGDKNSKSTLRRMNSRRENFLNELVTNVIDWMILYRVLPASTFEIVWDDLLSSSDDEKLTLGDKMASINEKSFRAGLSAVFSEDEIREASGYEELDFEIPSESMDNLDDEE